MGKYENLKDFRKNYKAILNKYVGKPNNKEIQRMLYRDMKNYLSIVGMTEFVFTVEKVDNGLSIYFPDENQRSIIKSIIKK